MSVCVCVIVSRDTLVNGVDRNVCRCEVDVLVHARLRQRHRVPRRVKVGCERKPPVVLRLHLRDVAVLVPLHPVECLRGPVRAVHRRHLVERSGVLVHVLRLLVAVGVVDVRELLVHHEGVEVVDPTRRRLLHLALDALPEVRQRHRPAVPALVRPLALLHLALQQRALHVDRLDGDHPLQARVVVDELLAHVAQLGKRHRALSEVVQGHLRGEEDVLERQLLLRGPRPVPHRQQERDRGTDQARVRALQPALRVVRALHVVVEELLPLLAQRHRLRAGLSLRLDAGAGHDVLHVERQAAGGRPRHVVRVGKRGRQHVQVRCVVEDHDRAASSSVRPAGNKK